jgi:predicted O-methyltransferase YrrM
MKICTLGAAALVLLLAGTGAAQTAAPNAGPDLDRKVRAFLEARSGQWRDMNVAEADGRILYDLIVKNGYTKALEIGTSTGHSGIWIAWALSKTGGRLVTIDIDEGRYREAVANFKAAGLDGFIDARLADAHELVPALPGPFDFVFCDADKDWYKNYFVAVLPKLSVGGAFAAHNVSRRGGRGGWGSASFVDYVLSLPFMETTFAEGSWAGLSVSMRRAEK